MSTQYSCSGCDRCEDCNTCQTCVKCELCDKCTSDCEVVQYIVEGTDLKECSVLGEFLSEDFRFSPSPRDEGVLMGPEDGHFNKASWDAIIEHYNKGKGLGKIGALLKKDIAFSTEKAVAPFSAAEYNRVSAALDGRYTVEPDTLIYGYYFTELERAVNNYKVNSDACDYCNVECDCETGVTTNCVACQECDKCEDCDTCQNCVSQTGCWDSCCGCDGGCQSSEKTEETPTT